MKRYIKVVEAAKVLGIHPDTLRRWDEIGRLKPKRTPGGTRLYSQKELEKLLKKKRFKKKQMVKAIGIFNNQYIDLGEYRFPQPEIYLPVHHIVTVTLSENLEVSPEPVSKRLVFKLEDYGRAYAIYKFIGYD